MPEPINLTYYEVRHTVTWTAVGGRVQTRVFTGLEGQVHAFGFREGLWAAGLNDAVITVTHTGEIQ